jgi:hypothetical protein
MAEGRNAYEVSDGKSETKTVTGFGEFLGNAETAGLSEALLPRHWIVLFQDGLLLELIWTFKNLISSLHRKYCIIFHCQECGTERTGTLTCGMPLCMRAQIWLFASATSCVTLLADCNSWPSASPQ